MTRMNLRHWRNPRLTASRFRVAALDYIAILRCNSPMTDLGRFKAEFFKALAHPLRIAVLDALRKGEVGVNDLCSILDVEQSTLSQQLDVLRNRNIVTGRKEGLNVFYSVPEPAVFKLLI